MANPFNGSTKVIAGISQANNQDFALMDSAAVQYKTEDKDGKWKSVQDKIEEIESVAQPITSEEIQQVIDTVFGEIE